MLAGGSQPKLSVYVRWRRLTESESTDGLIDHRSRAVNTESLLSVSVKPSEGNGRPWTSPPAYKAIFSRDDDNATVYDDTVAPAIPQVLAGGSCNFFAYGHSGSGKTHTIIGYDFERDRSLGLCLASSRKLFEALDSLNQADSEIRLGIGFSLFELRKNTAFDLLNGRTECHIRQGPDGRTHIRGQTELLEGGKVRVRPLSQRACWTFEFLRDELIRSFGRRAVGWSSVHD